MDKPNGNFGVKTSHRNHLSVYSHYWRIAKLDLSRCCLMFVFFWLRSFLDSVLDWLLYYICKSLVFSRHMCGLADFICEEAVWRNLLIIGGLQSWIWVAAATWYSYHSDSIRSCKNLASWIDWLLYHRCEPLVPHHSRFIRKISPYLEVGGSPVSPTLPHGTTYHKNLLWFLLHKLVFCLKWLT